MGSQFIRTVIAACAVTLALASVALGAYVMATKDLANGAEKAAIKAKLTAIEASDKVDLLAEIYLPVVRNMGYSRTWTDSEYLYIEVWGEKSRQCSAPLKIEALSVEDFRVTYSVEFMNDLQTDGTFAEPKEKPVSKDIVSFGVWRLKPIPQKRFMFAVMHNCSGQLVTTNFILKDYTDRLLPIN